MVWLVTHIWMFIGLAALLGLILGWALRGIRFSGGARRAIVERDIALTELGQVRGELDNLYSAQRTSETGDGAPDMQLVADLKARDDKLSELEAELTASRDALETVKADSEKKLLAAAAAAAAAVTAGGAAVVSGRGGQDEPDLDANLNAVGAQLEWRNRYLESRVRSLETSVSSESTVAETPEPVVEDQSERVAELEAGKAALQEQLTEAQAQMADMETRLAEEQSRDTGIVAGLAGAAAGAGAVVLGQAATEEATGEPSETTELTEASTAELDKMNWQNDYLRQRLAFLEEHGAPGSAGLAIPVEPETDAAAETIAVPVIVADETEVAAETAEADLGDVEQELARLRWRNRYLEGRLAYIDGDAVDEAAQDVSGEKTSAAEALLERLEKSDNSDV